ncbi:MAG: glycerophosphodiester phosphodiesterase [Clostridiales bacterium]|nr:glycerophosphodiester phosphodiesterase [Clostridiales bacterium]
MEIKQKKKRIKNHVATLLLYMFLHNALFLVVFVSVSSYALRLAIKASKYSYLTLQNMLPFLFSPVTLLLIVVVILIASLFFYVELITLSIYNQMKHSKDPIRLSQFVIAGLEESIRLFFKRKNYLLPLFSLLSGMIYALPLYIAMIFRQRIPSYIFDSISKHWYVVPLFLIILVIESVIAYRGMFAIFYVSFDHCDFFTGFKKSARTIREYRKKVAFNIIKYNFLLCVFYAVLYGLIVVSTGFFMFFVVSEKVAAASFLTTYDQINRYYAFVASVAGVVINVKVIYSMFLRYKITLNTIPEELGFRQTEISRNQKYKKYVTVAGVCIFVLFFVIFTIEFKESLSRQKAPLFGTNITAHRGCSKEAPENTLPAIQAAIDSMADYVEIDVQETKDGVIVLLHDSNLKRTTGVNKNIWSVTYDELQEYNAAKYFKNYETTRIPTLEEALLLCQNNIFMNIEVKVSNHEQELVEKVVRLIELYDMEEQCVITSSNYGALKRVKAANESIKTGYILSFAFGYFYNREYADFFSVKSSFITKDMIKLAHGVGKGVHAWTVNDFSEVERMKQLGVDNIITDSPIRVREIVYEDKVTDSFIHFLRTLTR